MNSQLAELMRRATAMTRTGDLAAAQALIREAMGQQGPRAVDVIDVEAREYSEPQTEARPGAAPVTPAGVRESSFISGTHAAAGLRCDYKLYIPPGSTAVDEKAPLIVMLHGCTQTPDDFAAGTRMNALAGARGCYVLYPAQSQQMNAQRCWNWFKHSHQARGRGEPALLESLTRHVIDTHGIDNSRVFVAGLSAGGAMAAILGNTYPETFAAVGVHSGLAAGAAHDLPSALAAMRQGPTTTQNRPARQTPTIVFHGDADTTVHPRNAQAVVAAAAAGSAVHQNLSSTSPAGRAITRKVYLDEQGATLAEMWLVHGAAHAWAGGSAAGSYTDARGPDASAEMLRFFLERARRTS